MTFVTMCLDWGPTAPVLNLCLATLSLWSAFGPGARPFALASALLYVALALCGGTAAFSPLPPRAPVDTPINGDVAEWTKALPC